MGHASRSGRASTNPSSPAAFGVCDRCGIWVNHRDLQWQYQWRGAALMNIRILCCRECLDVPSEQLRSIIVPADPAPILNARTEYFLDDESDYLTTSAPTVTDPVTGIPIPSTTILQTQDGQNLTTQPLGSPNGLEQGAVMSLHEVGEIPVLFGQKLPILSVTSNGSDQISVTCSQAVNVAPYNLTANSQVSIEGLGPANANGFYSISLKTATMFTYQIYGSVPAGSLLGPSVNVLTCLVGLPLGYEQIPLTPPGTLLLNRVVPPAGTPIGLLMALTYAE